METTLYNEGDKIYLRTPNGRLNDTLFFKLRNIDAALAMDEGRTTRYEIPPDRVQGAIKILRELNIPFYDGTAPITIDKTEFGAIVRGPLLNTPEGKYFFNMFPYVKLDTSVKPMGYPLSDPEAVEFADYLSNKSYDFGGDYVTEMLHKFPEIRAETKEILLFTPNGEILVKDLTLGIKIPIEQCKKNKAGTSDICRDLKSIPSVEVHPLSNKTIIYFEESALEEVKSIFKEYKMHYYDDTQPLFISTLYNGIIIRGNLEDDNVRKMLFRHNPSYTDKVKENETSCYGMSQKDGINFIKELDKMGIIFNVSPEVDRIIQSEIINIVGGGEYVTPSEVYKGRNYIKLVYTNSNSVQGSYILLLGPSTKFSSGAVEELKNLGNFLENVYKRYSIANYSPISDYRFIFESSELQNVRDILEKYRINYLDELADRVYISPYDKDSFMNYGKLDEGITDLLQRYEAQYIEKPKGGGSGFFLLPTTKQTKFMLDINNKHIPFSLEPTPIKPVNNQYLKEEVSPPSKPVVERLMSAERTHSSARRGRSPLERNTSSLEENSNVMTRNRTPLQQSPMQQIEEEVVQPIVRTRNRIPSQQPPTQEIKEEEVAQPIVRTRNRNVELPPPIPETPPPPLITRTRNRTPINEEKEEVVTVTPRRRNRGIPQPEPIFSTNKYVELYYRRGDRRTPGRYYLEGPLNKFSTDAIKELNKIGVYNSGATIATFYFDVTNDDFEVVEKPVTDILEFYNIPYYYDIGMLKIETYTDTDMIVYGKFDEVKDELFKLARKYIEVPGDGTGVFLLTDENGNALMNYIDAENIRREDEAQRTNSVAKVIEYAFIEDDEEEEEEEEEE